MASSFQLVSLNVNGLNDQTKRTTFIHWLQCLKADVVCLQETHAASHRVLCSWFRNSNYAVASSSISNKRAGTAILVSNQHQLHQVWRDDEGRLTQVEVSVGEQRCRVVSLYAPNKNPSRNKFFVSVADFLDLSVPTFLCGDFNSVLDPTIDRRHPPSYQRQAPSRGAESIAALQSLMSSSHTFPVWRTFHPNVRAYSWDHGSGNCSSRIDMIFAPIGMKDQIEECEYQTSLFTTDHRYVYLKASLDSNECRGPGYWKFNTSHLRDESYRDLVNSFWSFWKTQESADEYDSPLDWWDMGKFLLREATRSFAKIKVMAQSASKRLLQSQLTSLRRSFDAGDSTAYAQLCAVQEELRGHELREAQAAQVRSRCRWAEEGERSTAFFFSLEQKHRSKQAMRSIKDPRTGEIQTDPIQVLDVWRAYYNQLFTAETCDLTIQDQLLSKLARTLDSQEQELCEGPLSLEECQLSLSGLAERKTPGSDGFPKEFYQAFWSILGADLVRILNLAYESGELSVSQRRGLIVVLYKKGDKLETKNWRPISLLNCDYKIATRAIAGRLLRVIASVVSPDQTCGIPGRTIGENLSTLRDLVDYAEEEDIPVALPSLDQEKAFDRVDWGFLSRTLTKMGFGPSFSRWVALFYANIESAVVINGWTSPSFNLTRGVRQGCPLSPLLYVLSVEVLAANIRVSPDISGVQLPGTLEELRCEGYADDTTVVVTTDESINEVFTIYDQYERGSGAKLNKGKSKGMWLGEWRDRTDTPHGLSWVKQLPCLGAIFSASDCSREMWEPKVEKVEKRLSAWKGRSLSYRGKSLVINALALSQIWHLCSVFVMPAWVAKRLDKAIWAFFWSGKRDLVARRNVQQPRSAGGFGVINFRLQADALALQWLRRFRADSCAKWKALFHHQYQRAFGGTLLYSLSHVSVMTRARSQRLGPFHKNIVAAWKKFDGGLLNDTLTIGVSWYNPLEVDDMTTRSLYQRAQVVNFVPPHCVVKFLPTYGELYWSETWRQLHLMSFDRNVVDLNWKIAHGVLYTASRLVNSFGMRNIDVRCHCGAPEETLEHLFFECPFAQLLINWVYFQLVSVLPNERPFSVTDLLFGVIAARRKRIPQVFVWMLQTMKHSIWLARCDFRFRAVPPVEANCLKRTIAKVQFLLTVAARKCRTKKQRDCFCKEFLANGTLGSFNGEKLVFSDKFK